MGTQIVGLLLQYSALRAEVNNLDHNDQFPLDLACENGYEEVVRQLLAVPNINVGTVDVAGNTARHSGKGNSHSAVAQLLQGAVTF